MRIVSHKKLKEFYETKGYEDSRIALERWYDIVGKAEWKNLSDIKVDFLSADYVGNQHYVFKSEATTIGWLSLLSLQLGTSSFAGLVLIKITIR